MKRTKWKPRCDFTGQQLVWVELPVWIVDVSEKAFAIHEDRYVRSRTVKAELKWVPRSCAGFIRYAGSVPGEERERVKVLHDHEITAFQVQYWWAKEQRLI